jgi:hypothetical protein
MSRALNINAVLSRLWMKNTIKYRSLSVCPPAEYTSSPDLCPSSTNRYLGLLKNSFLDLVLGDTMFNRELVRNLGQPDEIINERSTKTAGI